MKELSQSQVQELLDDIAIQHLVFVAQHVGVEALSDQERQMIADFDVDEFSYIDASFQFGMLSLLLSDKRAKKMTFTQLKKFARSGNFVPLTSAEKFAVKAAKKHAYNDITGLGNRIQGQFSRIMIESDQAQRAWYEKVIRKETTKAIANRETKKQLISRIGTKTQDWARDFGRIADYVMHDAYDSGRAMALKRKYGEDVEVWKSVYAGACRHCIRLYLTNGIGSKPIVFKLDDLIANGSNIGRKSDQWKAVVGPTHPWCRCQLEHKPKGLDWNDDKQAFIDPSPRKRKVERKSKVRVTVGDKQYNV